MTAESAATVMAPPAVGDAGCPPAIAGAPIDDAQRLRLALSGIALSLAELREMTVAEQLFDAAARASVTRCGFDRAIVFTVAGSELITQSVHFGDDEDWAARTLLLGQSPEGRPHLDQSTVEKELARRRSAALVPDAQDDPHTPRVLVEATRTRSYVAAPILCDDQVMGFIHADRYFRDAEVDDIDRDVLFAFTVGVGVILERLLLRRSVRQQRTQLKTLAREIEIVADLPPMRTTVFDPHGASAEQATVSRQETLSAREQEVVKLLVDGATNAMIARRLFISESTVKAHVHHILKKLGATNRAEAVAKFLRGAR